MSSEVVLSVQNAGKCYQLHETAWQKMLHLLSGGKWGKGREFWALRNVSFDLRRGDSLGIVGVNGSGKSTLLQLIAGTLTLSTGKISVQGRIAALLELGAGFNPELTGRENIELGARMHGLNADELKARLPQILAFADIGEFIDQPVKYYSSGMFVRVAFALIAHVEADVMIVDEALAVGDAFFAQKCMRFLDEFMQEGTLIFVSHDMASVRSLCDRVIWLEGGQIREVGDPKTVGDSYLESRYGAQQNTKRRDNLTSQARSHLSAPSAPVQDFRLELAINPLKLKPVSLTEMTGFGEGRASIVSVYLYDQNGQMLLQTEGGRVVELRIEALLHEDLEDLVFGYFFRNRMGLNIFGDNTYLARADDPVKGVSGERLIATFSFVMPFLPKGEYAVCVALATGNNQEHVQQHWIHDALIIQSLDNHVHADVLAMPSISMSIERL